GKYSSVCPYPCISTIFVPQRFTQLRIGLAHGGLTQLAGNHVIIPPTGDVVGRRKGLFRATGTTSARGALRSLGAATTAIRHDDGRCSPTGATFCGTIATRHGSTGSISLSLRTRALLKNEAIELFITLVEGAIQHRNPLLCGQGT